MIDCSCKIRWRRYVSYGRPTLHGLLSFCAVVVTISYTVVFLYLLFAEFQEYKVTSRADIMVAYYQRRWIGCLTGFLGCRWRGYEQSSGNTTLVCVKTAALLVNFMHDQSINLRLLAALQHSYNEVRVWQACDVWWHTVSCLFDNSIRVYSMQCNAMHKLNNMLLAKNTGSSLQALKLKEIALLTILLCYRPWCRECIWIQNWWFYYRAKQLC